MISIPAIAFILALIALLLAVSGRLTAAVIIAIVGCLLFLASVAGYL